MYHISAVSFITYRISAARKKAKKLKSDQVQSGYMTSYSKALWCVKDLPITWSSIS